MPRPRKDMKTLQIAVAEQDALDLELLAAVTRTTTSTLVRVKLVELLADHRDQLDAIKAALAR